jgi:hypothetical protein
VIGRGRGTGIDRGTDRGTDHEEAERCLAHLESPARLERPEIKICRGEGWGSGGRWVMVMGPQSGGAKAPLPLPTPSFFLSIKPGFLKTMKKRLS